MVGQIVGWEVELFDSFWERKSGMFSGGGHALIVSVIIDILNPLKFTGFELLCFGI